MLTVDLNQRMLPFGSQIFCVYSGRYRRFYDEFKTNNLVFLETPDMSISQNTLNNDSELRQRIRRSDAIESAIRTDQPISLAAFPLSAFSGLPVKDDRSVNSLLGSFRHLFKTANPGDLIISPESGAYRKILFGELTAPPSSSDRIRVPRLGNLQTPFRAVRWIYEHDGETPLPENLSKLLSRRPAVSKIPVDQDTEEFYDIAYGNYITHHGSRANIYSPKYSPKNFYETNSINSALALILSAHNAIVQGVAPARLRTLEPAAIIAQYLRSDDIIYIKQIFASPGNTSIKSTLRDKGPAIGVLLSIFLAGMTVNQFDASGHAKQIEIINTAHPPSQSATQKRTQKEYCDRMAETVQMTMEGLGYAVCSKSEKEVQGAHNALGTTVAPKVVP